ncbi:biotin--[acetyl-CoA-carboxylase] ligase [Pedobacter sp. BS3]|uniref:biotin--[acetyl-CoA-carboxylase] ligase n=1 Tax=Pedobacter sp. BS3 TaxID=2567937 RepID=UPI0021CFB4B8|nr:biotin--[acetyl-CoA-carboxylase] ligase [Pedobacter sp. BS3]
MQNNTFSELIVGRKIIVLTKVDSTNNYLKNSLSKFEPLPHGTVILAEEQYAGRGQMNSKWQADPGKNLTFSLLLHTSDLAIAHQFYLNKAISIAINETIERIIGPVARIKWPNDVFAADDKMGGVLIENIIRGNTWKYAIIGIGINVNQRHFPDDIKNVTSISRLLQADYELPVLLSALCRNMDTWYGILKAGNLQTIDDAYRDKLYRFNEAHLFEAAGETFEGRIIDVDASGLLHVLTVNGIKVFNLKEIRFKDL